MKADVCDVCERKTEKYHGAFFTNYNYWDDHGYSRKTPSNGLDLCEYCRNQLLERVNAIRQGIDLPLLT